MVATRVGGHVALIGVLAGIAGPVKTALLMSKNLRVQGLTVGSRAQQLAMIAGVEANGIRPILDRHFPLEKLADAFRHQAANAHFGKIIVDITGPAPSAPATPKATSVRDRTRVVEGKRVSVRVDHG